MGLVTVVTGYVVWHNLVTPATARNPLGVTILLRGRTIVPPQADRPV
jgi:hypothetical protein